MLEEILKIIKIGRERHKDPKLRPQRFMCVVTLSLAEQEYDLLMKAIKDE